MIFRIGSCNTQFLALARTNKPSDRPVTASRNEMKKMLVLVLALVLPLILALVLVLLLVFVLVLVLLATRSSIHVIFCSDYKS